MPVSVSVSVPELVMPSTASPPVIIAVLQLACGGAAMAGITIIEDPSEEQLTELGVRGWPTWSAEVSTFPWSYDEPETCYFLEGDVVVTPDGGAPVRIGKGQLVTFPAGMSCTWQVRVPVHKHYRFG